MLLKSEINFLKLRHNYKTMEYSTTAKLLHRDTNDSSPPSYRERGHDGISDSIRCDTETLQDLATLTCGRECVIAQSVIDRLLGRMVELENEKSELIAANRLWASQYQSIQEKHSKEIRKMEEKVRRKNNLVTSTRGDSPTTLQEARDHMELLKHQALVYKEDFEEERKSRVRAHAQMEVLRSELKRERRSRGRTIQNRTSGTVSS
ncbi:uncharacterized protein LOC144749708 [Ciona intestinalis]